jgi:hypothetical protein
MMTAIADAKIGRWMKKLTITARRGAAGPHRSAGF